MKKATTEEWVTEGDAVEASLCADGVRVWAAEHFPGRDMLTVGELWEWLGRNPESLDADRVRKVIEQVRSRR